MSLILVFLTGFIWSSSFALSKLAMNASSPIFATGVRMVIAGAILGLAAWWRGGFVTVSKKILVYVLLLAVTGFYLTNICEFIGLQHLSASKACFIYGLSPLMSAFFSYIQLKEKVTQKKVLGLLLGLLSYICYLTFGGGGASGGWTWQIGLPEMLILGAASLASFGWTLLRKIEKETTLSVTAINAYAMLIAGILSLIHSIMVESWQPSPVRDVSQFLYGTLALVVVSNLICYNMYAKLLRKYSSTFLSFCNLIMPLYSGFYAWVLLGEKGVTVGLILAVSFMVAGCRLIYHEEFRQGYIFS
ncbi:S-adenosylmethionine/S-adenosylhomocysteine transporter,putative DMT superfamily transporter inner membrane protein,Predicted permease, DMT superfamily,carboxylate/amino acid/amine transporter,EamA-like transporter family [Chlamydia serpentis]|uniref:S-adenosylmethionine/S-adenosylhomocysteine transporter,putative DMT superfamily transporter inner membrane protein,Predicted permease, DMT superfamily,carboxylate/amino acid/amine transporter,EamA... n=1 Tax=Chlamydia serpentis TaxID=1967782 RepID=A0A2R8FBV3_9CHLA|nr:DMT family transporter [Chlamydia serpentis]SPN73919.1 S-adenosylmethionine/S-adenosylhomocysteine transporter,putative DMT superfamily transporter inner membrane protein,Predicted permease, DMT superfamily,carboxylate/amino acid/amine transporter,EamA-like transporter family [Chlamydia serpentis]